MYKNTNNPSKNLAKPCITKRQFDLKKRIISAIEKGTGKGLKELKETYSEDKLFYIGLKHVTTTKKAYCESVGIPIEAGCRYKRTLEKVGLLVQSVDEIYCPYTNHKAHQISTNPKEFKKLLKDNSNQLKLF